MGFYLRYSGDRENPEFAAGVFMKSPASFSYLFHSPNHSFTGCTQPHRLSDLRSFALAMHIETTREGGRK
jgi:hypothetical protein